MVEQAVELGVEQDDEYDILGHGRDEFVEAVSAGGDFWGERGPVDGIAADPRYLDVWVPPGTHRTLQVETDRHGHHKYIGLVVSVGPWTIYHAGDTDKIDEMKN